MQETAENLKQMAKFGISEGISELILTTANDPADGDACAFNAAPFGITWKNNRMFLHLFKGSKTCRNLIRENYFAANMTDDAVLYAMTTFYELEESAFNSAEQRGSTSIPIPVPVLKDADRAVLFKCLKRVETEDSYIIDIEPVDFVILNAEKEGFVFNRGFHSVVEACIHLTRYELTKDPKYIDLIRHHLGLTQRCGRKRDKEGFAVIKKRLAEK